MRLTLATLLTITTACGGGDPAGPDAGADAAPADAPPAPPAATLFVNFGGGTYTPGGDSAGANQAPFLMAPATLSPFVGASAADVVDCVRDRFAAYDIAVVTGDPGAVPHIEVAVTADDGTAIGASANTLAPLRVTCQPIDDAIGFVFAGAPIDTSDPTVLCNLIAQSTGALLALELVGDCSDVMGDADCDVAGDLAFQDAELTCSAQPCTCGGPAQNSHRELLDVLGPRP